MKNEIDSVQATEEEKINRIREYLEKKKTLALLMAQNTPDKKKPPLTSVTASAALGHNNDCKRNRNCKKEFSLLGCIKLYKLKTAQE